MLKFLSKINNVNNEQREQKQTVGQFGLANSLA